MGGLSRLAVLVAVAAIITPFAAAQQFTVDVSAENSVVNPLSNNSARFNITITNSGSDTSRFDINYMVSNPSWYFLDPYTMTLGPSESGSATLYAEPDREAVEGNKGINIRVTASDGTRVDKRAFFKITREQDILVLDYSTSKEEYQPGETVTATATVKNVRQQELNYNEYQAVFQLKDQEKTVSLSDLDPGESQQVEVNLTLDQFAAGAIPLQFTVENLDGKTQVTKTAYVDVAQTENVQLSRSEQFQFIATTTKITAQNVGNQPAEDTTVKASVPSYLSHFVSFDATPTGQVSSGGSVIYEWDIGMLEAGEAENVAYRINYWVPFAIMLILLTAGAVGVWEYRRPRIRKKTKRKNGKHSVHIHVKNRSGDTIEDATVTDFVPGIANLIEKFDSSPPERIRQSDDGTHIEWRLGRVEPGEERILTYKLSPQVAVEGSVTLPGATLSYDASGKEKSRSSHGTTADFR